MAQEGNIPEIKIKLLQPQMQQAAENGVVSNVSQKTNFFVESSNTQSLNASQTVQLSEEESQMLYDAREEQEIQMTQVSAHHRSDDGGSVQSQGNDRPIQPQDKYDGDEWQEIEATQYDFDSDNFIDTFIFKAPDGSTVEVKDCDSIQVKVNKDTGEIVVIGANNASVTLAKDAKLNVVQSTIENIYAQQGGETINAEGAYTTIANIRGGDGKQTVNVKDGAHVEDISLGAGNDEVNVSNAQIGKINAGKGDDIVTIDNSTIQNEIKTEAGKDSVTVQNQSILMSDLNTGLDDDSITIDNSTAYAKVYVSGGNNNEVAITNSKIEELSSTEGLVAGKANVVLENSTINNTKGLSVGTYQNTDSIIAGLNNLKGQKTVTSLDTTSGEYAGYKKLDINQDNAEVKKVYLVEYNGSIVTCATPQEAQNYGSVWVEKEQVNYTLEDGSKISLDNDGGEVYVGPNGEIVLNGAAHARISSQNSSKLKAINSEVLTHSNAKGEIEYVNSIVGAIVLASKQENVSIKADGGKISSINPQDSSLTIKPTNDTEIKTITSASNSVSNITIKTDENSRGCKINKIDVKNGDIKGDVSGLIIEKIKTQQGDIDLSAIGASINTIENKNEALGAKTKLTFEDVTLDKISTNAVAEIYLNDCSLTTMLNAYSDDKDKITVEDSDIKEIYSEYGDDELMLNASMVETLMAGGFISGFASDVETLQSYGDVALEDSEVDNLVLENNATLYAKNTLFNGEFEELQAILVDEYGNRSNVEASILEAKRAYQMLDGELDENNQAMYEFLIEKIPQAGEKYANSNLEKDELIDLIIQEYGDEVQEVKELLATELIGDMADLKIQVENAQKTQGFFDWVFGTNKQTKAELENKMRVIERVFGTSDISALVNGDGTVKASVLDNVDFKTILSTYSVVTDKAGDAQRVSEADASIELAKSLDNQTIDEVIDALDFIGNTMNYNLTEQDGPIKDLIAQLNNALGIGTTRFETQTEIKAFADRVKEMREKYTVEEGETLSENQKLAFLADFENATGSILTQKNIDALLDTTRGNEDVAGDVFEKIGDYQDTQTQIFQTAEFIVIMAAGTITTIATGGAAAGNAVAAGIRALGQTGMSLAATTASAITKLTLDWCERNGNNTVDDDLTWEEAGKTLALMYSGCAAGRFGNYIGDLINSSSGVNAFLSGFLASDDMIAIAQNTCAKLAEFTSDTLLSSVFTAAITGDASLDEEFYENFKSELVGLLNSKITGIYFKNHPELAAQTQINNRRSAIAGVGGEFNSPAVNKQLLAEYGLSHLYKEGMSSAEVDLVVTQRYMSDYSADVLRSRGIDPTRYTDEAQALNAAKVVDDLYIGADSVVQSDPSSCAMASILNAISNKPMVLQALAQEITFDSADGMYKFNAFGQEYEFSLARGENPLQKVYSMYTDFYGTNAGGNFVTRVFDEFLPGYSDVALRAIGDNLADIKALASDENSILTFNTNTSVEGLKTGHSYTVLGVADNGKVKLQDPATLEVVEVDYSKLDADGAQFVGKTAEIDLARVDTEVNRTMGVFDSEDLQIVEKLVAQGVSRETINCCNKECLSYLDEIVEYEEVDMAVINLCTTATDITCLKYLFDECEYDLNEFTSAKQIRDVMLDKINTELKKYGDTTITENELLNFATGMVNFGIEPCAANWHDFNNLDISIQRRLKINDITDYLNNHENITELQTNGIFLEKTLLYNDDGEKSTFILSEDAKEYASDLKNYRWNPKHATELIKHGYQLEKFLAQTLIIDGQNTTVGKYLYSLNHQEHDSTGTRYISIQNMITADGRLSVNSHDAYTIIGNAINKATDNWQFADKLKLFYEKQSDFKTLSAAVRYYENYGIQAHAAVDSIARNNTMIYSTGLNGELCSMTLEEIADSYDIFNSNGRLNNGFNYEKSNLDKGKICIRITSETGIYMGKFVFAPNGQLIFTNNR